MMIMMTKLVAGSALQHITRRNLDRYQHDVVMHCTLKYIQQVAKYFFAGQAKQSIFKKNEDSAV